LGPFRWCSIFFGCWALDTVNMKKYAEDCNAEAFQRWLTSGDPDLVENLDFVQAPLAEDESVVLVGEGTVGDGNTNDFVRVPTAAGVKSSFFVVLWDEPEEELSFYYGVTGSKHQEPLEVSQMERTKVHEVKSKEIHIHAKGEDGSRKIATVELKPEYKSSLIVLVPKEDGVFETIVVKDDPKSPPYGAYFFRNLSEMEIEGTLGDEEFTLSADSGVLVTPKAKDELGLELWHLPKGKKTFLQRNTLSYNRGKYLIIFLYAEESASGRVKLKSKGINILKGSK
jgi:hypothetical protein